MRAAPAPVDRGVVAADKIAIVCGVIPHHLHQLAAHLSVVVHDEQLHYGEAVGDGG